MQLTWAKNEFLQGLLTFAMIDLKGPIVVLGTVASLFEEPFEGTLKLLQISCLRYSFFLNFGSSVVRGIWKRLLRILLLNQIIWLLDCNVCLFSISCEGGCCCCCCCCI